MRQDTTMRIPIERDATCPVCLGRRLKISTVDVQIDCSGEPVRINYAATCPDCDLHIERSPEEPISWSRFVEVFLSADLRALAYLAGGR